MRGSGVVYINTSQVAKADKYFAKAYALSKNVSERERLYITGHYYQNVTGDMPKVVEALQESIQTYPTQIDSIINITAAYSALGDFARALPFAEKAVQMQPEDSIAAENLSEYLRRPEPHERCSRRNGAGSKAGPRHQHA